jgi:hypothetical protein
VNLIAANSDKKEEEDAARKAHLYPPLSLLLHKLIGIPLHSTPLSRTARDPKNGIASLPCSPVPYRPPSQSQLANRVSSLGNPAVPESSLLHGKGFATPFPCPILFSTESCRGVFVVDRGGEGANASGPRAGRRRRARAGCSLSRGGLSR